MPEQPCAFHPDRMTAVTCSRCDRPICPEDMIDAPVGIHCPVCAGRMRETAVGQATYRARTTLERTKVGRRLTGRTLTGVLIAINVAIAVVTLPAEYVGFGDLTGRGVLLNPLPRAQWWRVGTSMFLHLSVLHILFNMWALSMFGPPLEARYGKARLLALYLLSGVGGASATMLLSDVGASAGASGAIFGLFGAWFGFFLWHRKMRGAREQLNSLLMLLGINAVFGFMFPGINFYAHGGGLVVGFVLALVYEVAGRAKALRWMAPAGLIIVAALNVWAIAANSF